MLSCDSTLTPKYKKRETYARFRSIKPHNLIPLFQNEMCEYIKYPVACMAVEINQGHLGKQEN